MAEGAAQRTKYLKENPTRLYRQLEEDFAMKVQLEEEAKARYYKEEMGKYRRARPSDIINGNVVVRAPSPRGGRAASPGSAGRGPTLPFAFGSAAPGNRSPPGSASPMRRSTEIPGYDVAAYTQASSPSRRVPVDYLPNPRLYKPSSPGTSAGGASPPAHQQAVAVEEVVPTKTVFVFGHHTRIPASQEGAGPPRSRSPSPRGGRSIGSASPARSSSMMSGGESGHPGDRRSLTMSAGPHISSMAAMRASIHEDVTSNLGAFQHQDAEPAAKPKAKPASPRPKQAAARPTPTAAAPRAPAPAAAPAPPAAPPPQSPPPEAVQSQRSASPLVAETEPEQQESQVAAAAAEEEQAPAAAAAADTPPPPAPAPQPAGMDNDESATIIQSALRAKMDRDRVSKKAAEAAARPAPAKQAAAPPPADAPAPPPPAAAEEDVKPAATDAADNGDDVGAAAPVSPSAADADMLGSLMSADESAVIIQSAMRAKLDNEEVSAKLRARAE